MSATRTDNHPVQLSCISAEVTAFCCTCLILMRAVWLLSPPEAPCLMWLLLLNMLMYLPCCCEEDCSDMMHTSGRV